ncbi:MAG: universal stress protein [Gemmatimonadota bacterium]|nr:universal stress protein [Gemmatimonadota bacterium]
MIGRSVVVGVDTSDEARAAALLGRILAESAGGALHLVAATTHALLDVLGTRAGVDVERLHEGLISAAAEKVKQRLQDDFSPDELERSLSARLGRPEHVLAECGREHSADLFVVGGRRHRAPAVWIHRGTAHHLLRTTDQTVVIAGPDGPQIDRVLVSVDRSDIADRAIEVALEFSELLGVPIEAIHVVPHPTLPRGLDLGINTSTWIRQEEDEAHRDLRSRLPAGVDLRVLHGEVEETIRRASEGGPPTLLVLGAHGKGRVHRMLLGSTTEALLSDPPTSMAIIPTG